MPGLDLTGQRFGRLIAIKKVGKANAHGCLWLCKCDCGNEIETRVNYLRDGGTTSCGCYRREMKVEQMSHSAEWNQRHGFCKRGQRTSLHSRWSSMIRRCTDPKNIMYHRYGGRGIRVCEEWMKFEPFKDWALANGYEEHLAIDRVDGNGNYCPENCRWVTQAENNRNRQNNVYLTVNGKRMLLVDWARETNQDRHKLYYRRTKGWTDEEIVYGKK